MLELVSRACISLPLAFILLSHSAGVNALARPDPHPQSGLSAACGNEIYDPLQYSCLDGMLCPYGFSPCGIPVSFSCYNAEIYECSDGDLIPRVNTVTLDRRGGVFRKPPHHQPVSLWFDCLRPDLIQLH